MRFDFIGIGVSRSGTTWTWDRLVEHPNVYSDTNKEARLLVGTEAKYNSVFKGKKSKLRGEYCPAYLFTPKRIINRIKNLDFQPQLLTLFRNPVDRSFSQYKYNQWRLYRGQKESFVDWFTNKSGSWLAHPKLGLKYAECLSPFQEEFGNGLLVKLYDDMVNDPLSYIQEVYDFIGADRDFVPPGLNKREKKPYNVFWERNPIEFETKDRRWAVNYFRKSIKQFAKSIGRNLDHWLE